MRTRTMLWLASAPAALLVACSGGSSGGGGTSSTASSSWTCSQAAVPNGNAVECVSAATAATSPSYVCAPGVDTCPPPDVDAGPINCDLVNCFDDAGGPVGQGGGGAGSGGSGGDAGSPSTTDDAGGPIGQGGGGAGSDASTPGDDSGTSSGGPGGGGGGHGNGGGGGNPHDGGTGNGGGGGMGGGHGGGTGDGGGSAPDAGSGGSGGGGVGDDGGCTAPDAGSPGDYTCTSDGTNVTCVQPPTCDPGTHPSACGACIPDGTCNDDCVPPSSGGCWVTGGGFIPDADGSDSFGGNAMPMKSGTIRGEWEDVDHGTGNKAHGEAQYLYCRHVNEPGPGQPSGPNHNFDINQVYFGGPARWFVSGTWNDGYWFDVMAEDHGEGKGKNAGGPDYYHFTIRQISGAGVSGAVVYDTENNLGGGNIQIHPPNNGHPYTASALPPWVSLQP